MDFQERRGDVAAGGLKAASCLLGWGHLSWREGVGTYPWGIRAVSAEYIRSSSGEICRLGLTWEVSHRI